MAADGTETRHLLPGGKPDVDPDPILPHTSELHVNVLERLGESPSWTLDSHRATLARHCHCMQLWCMCIYMTCIFINILHPYTPLAIHYALR